MTIKEISKQTLFKFKNSGYVFTPKEYQEAFCKEAKKANILIEDCSELSNLIQKLDKKYQNLLKNYKIKTTYDLTFFLINHLNRENISKDKEIFAESISYLKRVLQVIEMLPINASKKIASKHLDFLKPSMTKDDLELLRKEWLDFMTTYDETPIKKAKLISKSKSDDIFDIIEAITKLLKKEPDFTNLIDSIIFSLTPSFAGFMNDEVAILKKQLKDEPALITSKSFEKELQILTKKRVKLDKDELKRKFRDIDKITEKLSLKILNLLKNSNISSKEIEVISKDLKSIHIKEDDFETVREKLITITVNLDTEINKFSSELKDEENEIKGLRSRISFLENELKEVKKESKVDFLTSLLNKKALDDAINKQEEIYRRYKRNYSLIFFDIDHFKNVNDTYGHDAGDIILKSVGLLLKRYSRDIDIIGRFGGEEFIAILPETDKEGAAIFANKINQVIKKAKFMYKGTRINITISAGVSERKEANSSEDAIKISDNRVYKAKETGRDKVVYE